MRHIVSYERHFVAPPPESDKIELIYHLILVDPRFFTSKVRTHPPRGSEGSARCCRGAWLTFSSSDTPFANSSTTIVSSSGRSSRPCGPLDTR